MGNDCKYSDKAVDLDYEEPLKVTIMVLEFGGKKIEKILQPFYRANNAKEKAAGNGIGLSLAIKIFNF
jgi:signal transduction histidine kinase